MIAIDPPHHALCSALCRVFEECSTCATCGHCPARGQPVCEHVRSSKPGLIKQVADRQREEFLAHLKPEVIARRQLGTPITWAEMQTMRCNSYEWQHLTPLFDNDALMRQVQHALNNSDHGGCPSTEYSRPCVTYPEQLERLLVPLLMQRLAAATGLTVPDFEIDTDAGFEPGEDDDATP